MGALGSNLNVDGKVANSSQSACHPESIEVKVSRVKADANVGHTYLFGRGF